MTNFIRVMGYRFDEEHIIFIANSGCKKDSPDDAIKQLIKDFSREKFSVFIPHNDVMRRALPKAIRWNAHNIAAKKREELRKQRRELIHT